MSTRKRLAITVGAVTLLGLVAIVSIWKASGSRSELLTPPSLPPVEHRAPTPPPITVPGLATGPAPAPAPIERVPVVPWDQVDELNTIRPTPGSPYNALVRELKVELRSAAEACFVEDRRRVERVAPAEGLHGPAVLRLLLEAKSPGRVVVTGVDVEALGVTTPELVTCAVKVWNNYELAAAGMPAGQRLKVMMTLF